MDDEGTPPEPTEEEPPKLTAADRQKLEAAERERALQEEVQRSVARERAAVNAAARLAAAPPQGSFTVRPEQLRLEFKEKADGSGSTSVARVAVAFELVDLTSGMPLDPCPSWWRPALPRAVSVDPKSGAALLGEEHLSTTGRFGLSEAVLSDLLGWGLQATVHQSSSGACNPAKDPIVGRCVVPLQRLLLDEMPEVKAEFSLDEALETPSTGGSVGGGSVGGGSVGGGNGNSMLASNGTTSFLRLSLTCDDDLSEFALGGQTLAFPAPVVLTHPPEDWLPQLPPDTPPAEIHDALTEAAAASAAGDGAFAFTLKLREATSAKAVTPQPALGFGPGVLAYDPPSPEVQAAADARAAEEAAEAAAVATATAEAGANEGDAKGENTLAAAAADVGGGDGGSVGSASNAGAAGATFVAGTWSLTFAPPPRPVFLTHSSSRRLQTLANSGEPLEFLVVRSASTADNAKDNDDAEPWAMVAGLGLDGLLNEGVCELQDVSVAFQPADLDEVATSNSGEGAKSSSDQKKKKKEKRKSKGGGAEEEEEDGAARRQRLSAVRATALAAALMPTTTVTTDQGDGAPGNLDGASSGGGGLKGTASVALRKPWASVPEMQGALRGMTAEDVVPPRREVPKKPPRNFQDELRRELMDMVRTCAEEYSYLFPKSNNKNGTGAGAGAAAKFPTGGGGVDEVAVAKQHASQEAQLKELTSTLRSEGVYHQFLERLKPRIQRVIRDRFAQRPEEDNEEALEEYLTQLYSFLMSEVGDLLGKHFAPEAAAEALEKEQKALSPMKLKQQKSMSPSALSRQNSNDSNAGGAKVDADVIEVEEQLEELRILALDAEANGDWYGAQVKQEDRLTEAVKGLGPLGGEHQAAVADAWVAMGTFCLRFAGVARPDGGPLAGPLPCGVSGGAAANNSSSPNHVGPHSHHGPKKGHGGGLTSSELQGKAIECLRTAVDLNPRHVKATRLLGAVLLEQGAWEKAHEVLQAALDLDTPSLPAVRAAWQKEQVAFAAAAAAAAANPSSSSSTSPKRKGRSVPISDEPPRSDALLAEPSPLTNVLAGLLKLASGQPAAAQKFLSYAVKGHDQRCRDRGQPLAPGLPRRTVVLLALQAAQYLCRQALPGLASLALEVAAKAETAAIAKAAGLPRSRPRRYGSATRAAAVASAEAAAALSTVAESGGVGGEPPKVRQLRLSCSAHLAMLHHRPQEALPLAEACQHEPMAAYAASGEGSGGSEGSNNDSSSSSEEKARASLVAAEARTLLGDIKHALGDAEGAARAYADALDLRQRANAEDELILQPAINDNNFDLSTGEGPSNEEEEEAYDSSPVPPLRTLVRLGALKLSLGDFSTAKNLFLEGTAAWQTCSVWLGAGIALLRQGEYNDAEAALQEANVRNNNNAAVWGYSCLLCLHVGDARVHQADRARAVAERLDLDDPTLLRELGNAYTELDRLETAEALFRRALAQDDTSAHTRRRLADVLAAQNAIADAVNEYLAVVHAYKASVAAQKEAAGAAALEQQRLQASARAQGSHGDDLLLQDDSGVPSNLSGAATKEKVGQDPDPAPRDRAECLAALTECTRLLRSLGRDNEIEALRALRIELQEEATDKFQ